MSTSTPKASGASTMSFLIADDLREAVVELARENDRSAGAEIRIALRDHLAAHQREQVRAS